MDHLTRGTATLLVALSTGCLVLEPAPTRPGSEEPASEEDGVRIMGSHNSFGYAMTALGDVDGDGLGDLAISEPGYAEEDGADPLGAIYIVYGAALEDPPEEALDPNHPALRWAAHLGGVLCGERDQPVGAGLAAVQGISGDGVQLLSTTTEGRYAYVLRELTGLGGPSCGGLEDASALALNIESGDLGGLATGIAVEDGTSQLAFVDQPGARCAQSAPVLTRVEGPINFDDGGTMASPVTLPEDSCAGSALAGGDLDGDGVDELVLGVPGIVSWTPYGDMATMEGRVYVTTLASLEGCTSLESCADASFLVDTGAQNGRAVALGDLDGDGGLDVAVGAPGWGGESEGADQVYVLDGETLLTDPDGQVIPGDTAVFGQVFEAGTDGAFGTSLAVPGDVFPDDADELAVGDPEGGPSGQVWLVYGPLSGVIDVSLKKTYARKLTDTGSDERIGETLAAAGDVNGDHIPDLLVGPPLEPGMEDEADVFLWYLE